MTLSLAKASAILCLMLMQSFSCFEELHCGSLAIIGWIHRPLLLATPPIPRSQAWRPMGYVTPDLQSSYLCHIFEPGFWKSVLQYIYYFAKLPLFELKCARFYLVSLGCDWRIWRTFRYCLLSTSWLSYPQAFARQSTDQSPRFLSHYLVACSVELSRASSYRHLPGGRSRLNPKYHHPRRASKFLID